jgi:hypothetical protein
MTQPHRRFVGEAQSKMTADLLRAPPLEKQLGDHTTELTADVDSASLPACPPHDGAAMSVERAIPVSGDRVAPQLPRNRRRRASEPTSDRPHTQPGPAQIGDLDTLVLGQVARADLTDRQPIQRRDEPDHDTVAVDLVPTRPDLAGRRADTPPPCPQLHEPLTLGRLRTTPRPLLHTTRRCQHNLQNLKECCDRT